MPAPLRERGSLTECASEAELEESDSEDEDDVEEAREVGRGAGDDAVPRVTGESRTGDGEVP